VLDVLDNLMGDARLKNGAVGTKFR